MIVKFNVSQDGKYLHVLKCKSQYREISFNALAEKSFSTIKTIDIADKNIPSMDKMLRPHLSKDRKYCYLYNDSVKHFVRVING